MGKLDRQGDLSMDSHLVLHIGAMLQIKLYVGLVSGRSNRHITSFPVEHFFNPATDGEPKYVMD